MKKYLFAIIVLTYVVSAAGIPIYFHYCDGELEKINYVVKSNSCCGGEENDDESNNGGCCKDENIVLKNTSDFTIEHIDSYKQVKTCLLLPPFLLSYSNIIFQNNSGPCLIHAPQSSPAGLQQSMIISTTVLRV